MNAFERGQQPDREPSFFLSVQELFNPLSIRRLGNRTYAISYPEGYSGNNELVIPALLIRGSTFTAISTHYYSQILQTPCMINEYITHFPASSDSPLYDISRLYHLFCETVHPSAHVSIERIWPDILISRSLDSDISKDIVSLHMNGRSRNHVLKKIKQKLSKIDNNILGITVRQTRDNIATSLDIYQERERLKKSTFREDWPDLEAPYGISFVFHPNKLRTGLEGQIIPVLSNCHT
jgi:hypothetical protein